MLRTDVDHIMGMSSTMKSNEDEDDDLGAK